MDVNIQSQNKVESPSLSLPLNNKLATYHFDTLDSLFKRQFFKSRNSKLVNFQIKFFSFWAKLINGSLLSRLIHFAFIVTISVTILSVFIPHLIFNFCFSLFLLPFINHFIEMRIFNFSDKTTAYRKLFGKNIDKIFEINMIDNQKLKFNTENLKLFFEAVDKTSFKNYYVSSPIGSRGPIINYTQKFEDLIQNANCEVKVMEQTVFLDKNLSTFTANLRSLIGHALNDTYFNIDICENQATDMKSLGIYTPEMDTQKAQL